MPICYWQLCHCPDATPCAEHDGFGCGLLNGTAISDEAQVNDPVTASLAAALVMLTDNATRIEAIKTRLTTQKADLEREKAEIERDAKAAKNRQERKAAGARADKANGKIRTMADELNAITAELDAMMAGWRTAIATGSNKLIIPYSDPGGYCACYTRKQQRLILIANRITNEQAVYANAQARYNAIRAIVLTAISDVKVWTGTFLSAVVLYAWFYFAFNETGALIILVALIVIAVALLVTLIDMVTLASEMDASQRRLAALVLMYYRLQKISTCKKKDQPGDDDSDWFEWFGGWLENPTHFGH